MFKSRFQSRVFVEAAAMIQVFDSPLQHFNRPGLLQQLRTRTPGYYRRRTIRIILTVLIAVLIA